MTDETVSQRSHSCFFSLQSRSHIVVYHAAAFLLCEERRRCSYQRCFFVLTRAKKVLSEGIILPYGKRNVFIDRIAPSKVISYRPGRLVLCLPCNIPSESLGSYSDLARTCKIHNKSLCLRLSINLFTNRRIFHLGELARQGEPEVKRCCGVTAVLQVSAG